MKTKTMYSSLSVRLLVSILLVIFVPSFIGLAILGMKTRDDFKQQAITHLRNELEIRSDAVANRLNLSTASLRLTTTRVKKELAASPGLALRLSLGDAPKEWPDDKLYRSLYNILENEILKHSGITEARIINSSGNELIRLIPTPSGIEEKAPAELENKAHREYFKNTMALPGGGIYIHPITLQKEHKKIIKPLMPVLRIAGKVTLTEPSRRSDAKADEVNFGIVIFNIRSEYIFGMRTSQKGSGFMITDENGYYLVHPDENALWGNELGHSANLFSDEPDFREETALKDDILNMDTGTQHSQRHDDYHAWRKIRFGESDPSHYWLLFKNKQEDSIAASWEQVVKIGFAGISLFILAGFGVLAIIITRTLTPLTEVADAMKRLEDGDLSARANVTSRTEIGRITHAFNSMADSLEKYRSDLQKSLAISSAMSDTAPNAHIVVKQDGKILSANRATERMFGYRIDELTEKDIKTLMPKPYNERDDDYVWDDLDMGIDRVVGFGMKELNAMRKGGEVFRVSVYLGKAKIDREAVFIAVISDISERKRFEAALLENEEKYRNLFKNANDAIYLIDPVTAKIIDCNQKAADMVGYGIDELKEMTVLDLHPKEERDLIPEKFREIMNKGSGTDISDFHHKRKDGRLVAVEISVSVIKIGGKRFNLGVARDITERKRAEEELKKRNSFIKLLQEISSQANESKSIEETLRFCIDRVCALTSWPVGHVYMVSSDNPDRLEPTSIWRLENEARYKVFHDVTMDTVFAKGVGLPGRVLATGKPAWIIDVMKDPNFPRAGAVRDIGVKAAFAFPILVRAEVAAVLEFFSPAAVEPDRQLLEIMGQIGTQAGRVIERIRAEEELSASEESYHNLFELSPDEIIVHCEGRIVDVNSTAVKLLKAESPQQLIGRAALDIAHPDEREFAGKRIKKVIEEKKPVPLMETRIMGLDGSVIHAEVTGTPVKYRGRLAVQAVIRDITERKRAEEAINDIAIGVSAETGDEFFRSLVRYLAINIGAAYAFAGELAGEKNDGIRTIAVCADGKIQENFDYELAGTPCINVVGKAVCVYPDNAQQQFPEDRMLVEMGVRSYIGTPLFDSKGNALGLLVVMDRKPLKNRSMAESMLKIFATRASAELERKKAEEAVSENREQLTKTLDSLLDAVFIIDVETVVINNCNPAASKIFGYDREEMIGRTTTFLHVDEDALKDFRKHLYPAVEEKGVLDSLEFKMKRKNGEIFLTEHSVVPLKDDKGKRVGWVSVVRDITERKQAEEELVASEAKYRMLMDSASDAIGICDIDGTILEVNGQMARLTGYSKEELIGRKFQTLLPKSVAGKTLKSFKNVIKKGLSSPFEGAITRKDGVEVPTEVTSSMVEYEGRQAVQSSIRDITKRKRAEEEMRQFKTTLDQTMDCVFMFSPETLKFLYVNKGAVDQVGYRSEELLEMTPVDIKPEYTEKSFRQRLKPLMDGRESSDRFETVHRHKNGTDIPVEVFIQYIAPPGEKGRFVAIVRNVAERKQAEKELKEAKMTAEKANEAKTRFVAKTNHELRNPLTSMISMLKLIVSDMCESRGQEKEFIKNVYNSSVHLRGLIEHLLDLSVIESGRLKMNMRSVRIDELLELVRQITWIGAKEKGLELTFVCDFAEKNRMIYCDPDRMRELLVNLVNNAIKFTEKGSVNVACRVPDEGEMRTLEIIDTGIGIEPEKLKEVFNPFVQAEGNLRGGAGLGLTLAKKYVSAMGGGISIESKGLGLGAKVTLSLPQAPVENKNRKRKKVAS